MPQYSLPPGPPVPNAVQGLLAALSLGASSLGLPGVPATRSAVPGVHRLRNRYGDMFTVSLPGIGQAVAVADPATLTHEDPRLFGDPMKFDPDRFICRRPDPFAWVPFGGGRPRCPGAAFAHIEMDVVSVRF
jgi:cytochrome P450